MLPCCRHWEIKKDFRTGGISCRHGQWTTQQIYDYHLKGDPMKTFGIGQAVKEMQDGNRVCRSGWNGKGLWVAIQRVPGEMTEPYVYMKTAQGGRIPWLCSQADLLAIDWELVSEA